MTQNLQKIHKNLQRIPGVGKSITLDLIDLGVNCVEDLANKDPQKLYEDLCALRGTHIDRCMLYVFRCAVYFASEREHDPKLLLWWNWKDRSKGGKNESERKPEIIRYPEIAEQIRGMHREDQTMRKKWRLDPKNHSWDEAIDRSNTVRLKTIVHDIGVLTVSKVGRVGAFKAWILVQHADHDVDFQEQYLSLMKHEPEAEIDQRNIAYLSDRVALNRGQLQIFGTQFCKDTDGNMTPRPIADPENLEKRRKEMGLEPFETWK